MTKLLAKVYWKQFQRSFSTLRFGQIVPFIAIFIFGLMVLPILFFAVSSIGEVLPVEMRANVFSIVTLIALLLTLLFSIPFVFKHLFSSKDVELLFTMPIATKHIYWIKYFQSFFSSAVVIWIVLFLFFIAFGIGANVYWLFYLIMPFISLAVVFIGLSIAYFFNLLLIQILPRNRAKELMTLMTGLAGFLIFILFQLPNLMGWDTFTEDVGFQLPAIPLYLPNRWAGESLSLLSQQFSLEAIAWTSIFLIFAIGLTFVTSTVVERGFRTGWIRLSEGAGGKRKKKHRKKQKGILKHPIIFLGIKDLRAIQRDPREWMAFLPLLFIMIIPIFPLINDGETLQQLIENPLASWLIVQGMILFFFPMLTGNFVASSIGREEKAIWILRTLPVTGMQIALGKLWIHWLIPFSFVVILEVVISLFLGWAWYLVIAGIFTFGLISLGMSSIGLWAGTIGGKYNPNNPQQRIETGTGFLLMLIDIPYMLLMVLVAILLFLPTAYEPFITEFANDSIGLLSVLASLVAFVLDGKMLLGDWSTAVGIIVLFAIVFTITYVFLWLSAKRMDEGIQITIVEGTSTKTVGGRKYKRLD